MATAATRYITIYTEANPNPNSLKFVLNYVLVPEGATFDFPDREAAAQGSPLAEALFGYPEVERVFVMNNFITITKTAQADWHDLAPRLKQYLKEYLEANKPLMRSEALRAFGEAENQAGDEPELHRRIRQVLDEYVRPAVESDGGAISFHSFHEGKVKVLLQGACSGCPSSTLTLKMGIETLLKRMVPEVEMVEAEGV